MIGLWRIAKHEVYIIMQFFSIEIAGSTTIAKLIFFIFHLLYFSHKRLQLLL